MAEITTVDPHVVDENPEELLGAVILDPWTDKSQIDWPNNEDPEDDTEEDVIE